MGQLRLIKERRIHIAIMKKSWGLTGKILSGEKKIESRWYMNRSRPWGQINPGDIIYFKDSGDPVKIKAEVGEVLQFNYLNCQKVREILEKYGKDDGITRAELPGYYEMFKNKKYCLLIFLKNVKKIEPFEINKKGFGSMAAWITIDDLERIKIRD